MPKKSTPMVATNVVFSSLDSSEHMIFPALRFLMIESGGRWGGDVITASTLVTGVRMVLLDDRPRDTPIYDYVCGLRRFQP